MATMTTHAALNEAGAGQPWRGDDFPDWLSPMLVRELRQGIQSGAFFWTFLLLQAALVTPFPLAGLLRLFADRTAATTLFLAGLVVLAIILAIVARPWWREMRETWRLVGPETRP